MPSGLSSVSRFPAFQCGQDGCFGFRFGRFFGQLAVELFGGFQAEEVKLMRAIHEVAVAAFELVERLLVGGLRLVDVAAKSARSI